MWKFVKHVDVHEPKDRTIKERSNKNLINYKTHEDAKNKNQFLLYVYHTDTLIFFFREIKNSTYNNK